jgi:hypothetical protein
MLIVMTIILTGYIRSNCSLGATSWNGRMRLSWAQLRHQSWMRSTKLGVMRKKWIAMHVRGTSIKIWFGVIICKWKRGTSIFVHDSLTFLKHIYVEVNAYVITMRPRFMLQGWEVGAVGHSRGKGILCIIYFPKSMLDVVRTLLA